MAAFNKVIRGIQTLFPSSGTEQHQVNRLSTDVVPVWKYPPRPAAYERIRSRIYNSTPASLTPTFNLAPIQAGFAGLGSDSDAHASDELLTVNAADVVFNRWVEIIYGDVSHDSATPPTIQLAIRSPVQNIFIARWVEIAQVLTNLQPSGFEPMFAESGHTLYSTAAHITRPNRPLIIPPGHNLAIFGSTEAANWVISLGLIWIVHPLSEEGLLF